MRSHVIAEARRGRACRGHQVVSVVASARVLIGVLALSLVCVLVLSGGSAQALLFHVFEPPPIEEILPTCPGALMPGKLGELNAMMGDSGHLWVAEKVLFTSARTDEFNASTPYACERQLSAEVSGSPTGVAVGHANGATQVYVGYREGVVGVSSGESGAPLERWSLPGGGEVNGVAVDNSPKGTGDWAAGDVLVADNSSTQHAVDVLEPKAGGGEEMAGQLTGTSPTEPFHFPQGIAVDHVNGDVLVVDSTEIEHNLKRSFIDVFEPEPGKPGEYKFLRKITGTPSGLFGFSSLSIAVDGSEVAEQKEGQVYVGEGGVIDEFSLTGEFLGGITNADLQEQEQQPGASLAGGVAVDPLTHHVFASVIFEGKRMVDGFGPNVVIPDVTTKPPTNVEFEQEAHLWSARMHGTVNPDDAGEASCWFVWGTSKSFGHVTQCGEPEPEEPEPVPNGDTPVGVHAELLGLQSDTTYYYRLQAKNSEGTNFGDEDEDQEFLTPGPGLHGESVSEVTSSSVVFEATINPNKGRTFYRFEYDTSPYEPGQASHGVSVPSPEVAIGDGESDREVEEPVLGLAAGTTYHYRVVVTSEVEVEKGKVESEVFDGPDQTFNTQTKGSPLVLPDGRAWELVSPPDKHGALIRPIGSQGLAQASAVGNAFTYLTIGATEAEPQGNPEVEQVLSERCDGGWSSRDIVMPHSRPIGLSIGQGFEDRFFSENLSFAVVEPLGAFSPPEAEHVYEAFPEATERTPYVRNDSICQTPPATPYEPIVSDAPGYEELPAGTKFGGDTLLFGDVNFVGATLDADHVVLESQVPLVAGGGSLYEWNAGEVLPSERLQPLYVLPEGEGGGVVGGGAPAPSSYTHQLSNDGSVFFDSGGHLYLEDVAGRVSVRLDVAQQGVPEPSGAHAGFLYASSDGSRVLFSDPEQLTSAPGGGVYECRIAEVEGRPACGQLALTGISGEGRLIGGSEDASYLYFVGDADNLYVAHDGAGVWETHPIVTLSSEDSSDWAIPRG